MAQFPRTILPEQTTDIWSPGALKDLGLTGIIQIRATLAVGWSWQETWGPLSTNDIDALALLAFVKKMWNRGEIHDITHPLIPGSGKDPNGLGTAGIQVSGGSQVGDTLLTDQWPINTPNCVRAGDVIKIGNDNAVYLVTADAGSNGTGQVDIPINPPIRTSPANLESVTTTNVNFRVTLTSGPPRFVSSVSPSYFAGLKLVFTEAL